jgi:hypothetical protein
VTESPPMDEWLTRARDALAAASGVPASQLEVDGPTERILLELARVAAHDSGLRTNAPILCYLVGAARRSGRSVEELAEAVLAATTPEAK